MVVRGHFRRDCKRILLDGLRRLSPPIGGATPSYMFLQSGVQPPRTGCGWINQGGYRRQSGVQPPRTGDVFSRGDRGPTGWG